MSSHLPLEGLVNDAYEDVALIFGGFLAQTSVLDEAAWKLAGEVSDSWFRTAGRARALSPVGGSEGPDTGLHPSVRALLAAVRATDDQQ